MSLDLVVMGCTGRLHAVAVELIRRGNVVRAVTRAASSPSAMRLGELGAVIVSGDLDDQPSLVAAAEGADGIFAAGTAHKVGPEREIRHGRNVADAARAAGVKHLVYASAAGSDQQTGIPVFESKCEVEQYISSLGVPATIVCPAYFMENLFNPWNLPALRAGKFPSQLPGWVPIQQVAISDIASFVGLVFERPNEFIGVRVEIASDELTGIEAAAELSRVTGTTFEFTDLPVPGLAPLFSWLENVGYRIDLTDLHDRYPEVGWHSFGQWAASQDWVSVSLAGRPA